MNRLRRLAENIEDLGGYKSPSFKLYARKFKNDFNKELSTIGAKITSFNAGHYYVSGFFRTKNNECFYFSQSDLRHFNFEKLMYRTAKDEKDYTGGMNRFIEIETGMVSSMILK